jgi:hypothetical protein
VGVAGLRAHLRVPLSVALAAGVAANFMLVAGSAPEPSSASALRPEFDFVRLMYTDANVVDFGFRRRNSWYTDAPDAETHFMQGLTRLTRVDAAPDATYVRPIDPEIFNHPWVYAVEVGHWYLSDEDAAQMREYLLRGGFLMVDDFHGTQEWQVFMDSIHRVFPDKAVVEIPDDHEVFHVLYDLGGPVTSFDSARNQDESGLPRTRGGGYRKIQIPGLAALRNGVTYEKDGVTPHWRGIFDDQGRLMVAINFNMDMGDAWELADRPFYPQMLTALAYRFGVNYVLYAMTH